MAREQPRRFWYTRQSRAAKRWDVLEEIMRKRGATELAIGAARYNWFANQHEQRTVSRRDAEISLSTDRITFPTDKCSSSTD